MERKKSILIVSPFFAPENSVAAVRFTKIGKYLSRIGYEVDAICGDMTEHAIEDETLKPDRKWFHRILRLHYPALYYLPLRCAAAEQETGSGEKPAPEQKPSGKPAGAQGSLRVAARLRRLVLNDTTMSLWVDLWDRILAGQYFKALRKEGMLPYDAVITTYSPLLSHYLGNRLKRKGLCRVWIADYRDNFWAFEKKENMPRFLFKSNARMERNADWITVVSEGEKKRLIMESQNPKELLEKKISVIRNGFDPQEQVLNKYYDGIPGKLVFTYCGTLLRVDKLCGSDLTMLFRALSELAEAGKVEKERLLFQYAGRSGEILRETAERYGLLSIVENHGFVPRERSLELQRRGDIVLICTWNRENRQGIISGKFYEAVCVKKPMLALVTGPLAGSEVKTMVKDYGLGYCCEEAEPDDFLRMKEWILDRYREKAENGEIVWGQTSKREELGHDRLAGQLARIIENLVVS